MTYVGYRAHRNWFDVLQSLASPQEDGLNVVEHVSQEEISGGDEAEAHAIHWLVKGRLDLWQELVKHSI